jgi:hypothetical protein
VAGRSLADVPALSPPLNGPPAPVSNPIAAANVAEQWSPGAAAPGHPSVLPDPPRPRPSRRNRPPSWLWARPGVITALVCGGLVASSVGAGAWRLHAEAERRQAMRIPVTGQVAPDSPAAPTVAASAAPQPTPTSDLAGPSGVVVTVPAPRGLAAGGSVSAGQGAQVGISARPGKLGAGARAFGPWQCGQDYRWDIGHPVLAKPCFALGAQVRITGYMEAVPGVQADVSLTLEDVQTGRVVAGPHTCRGLMFTDFAPQHQCGPFEARPTRGRRYVVVQSWQYTGRQILPGGTARGPQLLW